MEDRMLSDEILLGLIKKAGGDVSKVEAEVAAIKDGTAIDSFADVETALAGKADMDIVADAFSAAETYAEGDYCTYEGGLYKFKTAHEGAWDAADVDQIQIAGELSELKNTITKHSFGTGVNIVDLTKNVDYVCGTDGYFYISTGSNLQKTYAYGYVNGHRLITTSTPMSGSMEGYMETSVFCRRGTTIKFQGSADAFGYFYKLL